MIVTISGASGVGKTTIEKSLLKRLPNVEVVVSITTRCKRDNDNPDEYRYISKLFFRFLGKLGVFLWTVNTHDNWYGTLESSVRRALKRYDDISMMILVPDRVKNIWDYAREHGYEEFVLSFYILSPSQATLKERLGKRGDSESEIAKRIRDCELWDAEAQRAQLNGSISYVFINNDTNDPEDAVNDIISHVNQKLEDQLF